MVPPLLPQLPKGVSKASRLFFLPLPSWFWFFAGESLVLKSFGAGGSQRMHPDPAPSPGDQDCPQGQPRQLLCSQKPPTATLLDLNPFFLPVQV